MKKVWQINKIWFDRLIKQIVMEKKPNIIRDKANDKVINDIWTIFETEEEKEAYETIVNDRIIKDIRT